MRSTVDAEMFRSQYETAFEGDANWQRLPVPTGDIYAWDEKSTYIKKPPYFDKMVDPEHADRRSRRPARAGAAGRFGHHGSHFARRIDRGETARPAST